MEFGLRTAQYGLERLRAPTRMKASEDIEEHAANALDSLSAIAMALSVRRVIGDGCTLTDVELRAIIDAVSKAVESVKRIISLSTTGPVPPEH
jgi:hypothetical protein